MRQTTRERALRVRTRDELDALARVPDRWNVAALLVGVLLGALLVCGQIDTSSTVDYVFGAFFGGAFGFGAATMAVSAAISLRALAIARWLDVHDWRPRQGFRHPRGRTDTHPRWAIERNVDDGEVVVGLRRWEYRRPVYETRWYRDPLVDERRFGADALDAADEYAERLVLVLKRRRDAETRRLADETNRREADRLLRGWVETRADVFVDEAAALPRQSAPAEIGV